MERRVEKGQAKPDIVTVIDSPKHVSKDVLMAVERICIMSEALDPEPQAGIFNFTVGVNETWEKTKFLHCLIISHSSGSRGEPIGTSAPAIKSVQSQQIRNAWTIG